MTSRLVLSLMLLFWAAAALGGEEPVRGRPTESKSFRDLTNLRVSLTFPPVVTEDRYLTADLRIDNVGEVNCEVPMYLEPSDAIRIDWKDDTGKGDHAYPAQDQRSRGAIVVLSPGSYLGSRILLGRSGWPCGQSDMSGCSWPAGKYEFSVTLAIPETPSNSNNGISGMTFKGEPAIANVKER